MRREFSQPNAASRANVPDAGAIVSTSSAATEHSWEAARGYYMILSAMRVSAWTLYKKPHEGRGSLPVLCASAVIKLNWLG
jgi:hypothetical protein